MLLLPIICSRRDHWPRKRLVHVGPDHEAHQENDEYDVDYENYNFRYYTLESLVNHAL